LYTQVIVNFDILGIQNKKNIIEVLPLGKKSLLSYIVEMRITVVLESSYNPKQLLASCPFCRHPTLFTTHVKGKNMVEILACKSCKVVLSVDKLKKILWSN